jgi:hypothetical protein
LDRTNFFQAKLALITLEAILKQFGVCNRDLLAEMRDNNADNDFIRNFRHIWADNGDAISFHYTGTGSTHTEYLPIYEASHEMAKEAGWAISSISTRLLLVFTIRTFGISTRCA